MLKKYFKKMMVGYLVIGLLVLGFYGYDLIDGKWDFTAKSYTCNGKEIKTFQSTKNEKLIFTDNIQIAKVKNENKVELTTTGGNSFGKSTYPNVETIKLLKSCNIENIKFNQIENSESIDCSALLQDKSLAKFDCEKK
ncbi:MAG: hypothetical protein ACRCXZ_00250 [Patescibacteria group bacterium]